MPEAFDSQRSQQVHNQGKGICSLRDESISHDPLSPYAQNGTLFQSQAWPLAKHCSLIYGPGDFNDLVTERCLPHAAQRSRVAVINSNERCFVSAPLRESRIPPLRSALRSARWLGVIKFEQRRQSGSPRATVLSPTLASALDLRHERWGRCELSKANLRSHSKQDATVNTQHNCVYFPSKAVLNPVPSQRPS